MAFIKTKSMTITELFEKEKSFIIPEYQRKFEWDDDILFSLIDELCKKSDSTKRIMDKIIKYEDPVLHEMHSDKDFRNSQLFLGNIVLDGKNIVDGQQRLTSLMIIMKVITNILNEQKGSKKDDNFQKYNFLHALELYLTPSMGSKRVPLISSKVVKQTGVNEAFLGLKEKSIGRNKIQKSYVKAHKKIMEKQMELNELEAVAFKILSVQIIVLSLSSIEEAFYVFEKLNSKSTPLAPADLIKNTILKISYSNSKFNEAKTIFGKIYENLNEFDLTSFIRMVCMIYNAENSINEKNVYVKKNSLYREMFEKQKPEKIMELFKKIEDFSEIYAEFFDGVPAGIEENCRPLINRFLDTKKIKIISTLTLYLTILFKDKKIHHDDYIYSIRWLENFSLRMFTLANNPAKEVDKIIPKVIFKFAKEPLITRDVIRDVFKKNLEPELKNEEDPYRFLKENGFNNEKSKHLLLKLWDEIGFDEKGVLWAIKDYKCHLEHLLPQKPIHWINEKEGWEGFDISNENGTASKDDDIYKYIYQIGNHFLVKDKDNISAGNKVLSEKITKLREDDIFDKFSLIEINKSWSKEDIMNRSHVIYNKFKEKDILSLE